MILYQNKNNQLEFRQLENIFNGIMNKGKEYSKIDLENIGGLGFLENMQESKFEYLPLFKNSFNFILNPYIAEQNLKPLNPNFKEENKQLITLLYSKSFIFSNEWNQDILKTYQYPFGIGKVISTKTIKMHNKIDLEIPIKKHNRPQIMNIESSTIVYPLYEVDFETLINIYHGKSD